MQKNIEQSKLSYTFNNDGEIEFQLNGTAYCSVGQATFDNSPNNNFSTYSASLVCPDSEYPDDIVGRIEWDIISPNCDDESNACDWDKFVIYIDEY